LGLLLLSFRCFLELPPSHLKICKHCGAVSESVISRCPAKKPNTLDSCESSDFKFLTSEELRKMDKDGIRAYFKKWPEWPNSTAWHQILDKKGLEKERSSSI